MTGGLPQRGATTGAGTYFSGSTFHGPVQGNGVQHNHYGAPRLPATWPHQTGTALPPQAAFFHDRPETSALAAALAGGGEAVLGHAAPKALSAAHTSGVVAGLGGVGKSQIAARYARTAMERGELDVLVWVSAANRATVVATYAQAATELIGSAAPDDPEQAAVALLAWLEPKAGRPPCRWLVVLDDLSDPADMTGLWPPRSPIGRTLITTRRQDHALLADRHLITVGVFSPSESRTYLEAVLEPYDLGHPTQELDDLAADLGHLPLALAQAAAYIAELSDTGMTPAAYRRLLADRTTALRDAAPDRLPDGQTLTVAATWSLSIEHADALRPAGLACPMLHLAAFLDPNGIPDTVLTSLPARTHLAKHLASRPGNLTPAAADNAIPGAPATSPVSEQDARRALSALRRLSLITHSPGDAATAVRVHRLVQRAVSDTLTPHEHYTTARTCADALTAAWPSIERDTSLAQALRANTAALITSGEAALYRPDLHFVLYLSGQSLGGSGQATGARDYFRRMLDKAGAYVGPDHHNTLAVRGNLAHWRGKAGDAAGAMSDLAELLPDVIRVLGPDHPETLSVRHNLACWRGEARDPATAAAGLAELLPDVIRVRGADAPETLITRSSLGRWRGAAGDAARAAADFAALLPTMVRKQGPDHPDTLTTRHWLAHWRGAAGDAVGAAAGFAELLPDTERVLGPDHPDTLVIRSNLAHWRGGAGHAADAVSVLVRLLPEMIRRLGPDHPETLTTRHNLVHWRGEAGDPPGAVAGFAELLQDVKRVLGPDHRETLLTRGNLARWRGRAGNAAGAVADLLALLPDMTRVLGPDHPDLLIARSALARWQWEAGDRTASVATVAALLDDRRRVLGPDHPDTLSSRHQLAELVGQQGNAAGAAAVLAELLPDMVRVRGPRHPGTLQLWRTLVRWTQAADHRA
ncbi:tetratricopeptide repeat protein [Streptomyces sp. NPDC046881]|uniref:tetratricopeptide repeat protein n=1 Tax=Streptomyces sp. NPDC046881 TaxID=3155374 RepID=UPI0033F3C535